MSRLVPVVLLLVVAFPATCALADDIVIENLLERISALRGGEVSAEDCHDQFEKRDVSNGAELFYGYGVCGWAEQDYEATLLLVMGQVRAVTDMELLEPATEVDQQAAALLWGYIFYYFGGLGPDSVYLDPAMHERLVREYEGWVPVVNPDYDPGWGFASFPDPSVYLGKIEHEKARRARTMKLQAILQADRDYRAAHVEFLWLQQQNPHGFVAGTSDYDRSVELQRTMSEISQRLKEQHAEELGYGQ